MAPKEAVVEDKKKGGFFKMFKVCCTGKESSKPGLMDDGGNEVTEHFDSAKILKREQQIHLHTQRRSKRRERIAARKIDVTKGEHVDTVSFPKTDHEREFLDEALGENFIFSDLNDKERYRLIDAMEKEIVPKGKTIIKQGDVGDYFYVVEDGAVNFFVDGDADPVGSCANGESFGELALLYDAPRAATCRAGANTTLWKVDQSTFRLLLARQAVTRENKIVGWLKKVPLFGNTLTEAQLRKFGETLTPVKFSAGERIVNKGDTGDIFYIIADGKVKVHEIGLGDSQGVVQTYTEGDWFGERALLTGEPRAANVTAITDVMTEATDRHTFEKAFGPFQQLMDVEMKKRFLKGVPIFDSKKIRDEDLDQLCKLLSEVSYNEGTKLAEEGKPHPQSLWIVKSGEIVVYDNKGRVYHLNSGDYYGDNSIREEPGKPSSQNVECKSNTTCWVITRSEIESVIGDMKKSGVLPSFVQSVRKEKITIGEVKKHRILGSGAFGKVWLATYDEKPFALKMLNKKQLIDNDQVDGVLREKALLSTLSHPFVLPFHGAFQDDQHLYLLLELMQGGELFNVIHAPKNKRRGISNGDAVFYGACVIASLAHMHQRLIAYRDLKPENILIDADGYAVIVDLGFAKVVGNKTYTLCGTPEYLAPEIITSKGHDKAADYWAFGVLVYEMLVGRSAFYVRGADNIALFKNIVCVKYSIPRAVNGFAQDLIKKLLVRNQATRLGNLSRGHLDIMEHAWFQSINFATLSHKEMKAPWIPEVQDPFDVSNFEQMKTQKESRTKALSKKEQDMFEGF